MSKVTLLEHALRSPEAKLIDRLAGAFRKEGVVVNGVMARRIIDFVQLRKHFLDFKKVGSKRQFEKSIKHRLKTIQQVKAQLVRDEGYYEYKTADRFIEDLLLVTLLEKASIIDSIDYSTDIRDADAFGFHLWIFKQSLISQKIKKPTEVLAVILESSKVMDGVCKPLKSRTIHNKCSRVQQLFDDAQKEGACHVPRAFGSWPRVKSAKFINDISGDCSNCKNIWSNILNLRVNEISAIELAYKDLSKKMPRYSGEMRKIINSIESTSLEELLQRTPPALWTLAEGIFAPLWTEEIR